MASTKFTLSSPAAFLSSLKGERTLDLGTVDVAEAWALVGLAALARHNGDSPVDVQFGQNNASKFALALGLQDVIDGGPSTRTGQQGRTCPLRRVRKIQDVETAAREIAELMVPSSDEDDSQKTIRYVLVELLRNAIQHSADAKGGVVAAQRMTGGYAGYPVDVLQVAVADAGIGLHHALMATYPDLANAEAAVVTALQPHVSGAFEAGRTGSKYNAGMGLFFISEMAKLTAGRMLLSTRGTTLWLRGNLEDGSHQLDFLPKLDFPGTLVAFELPFGEPADHEGLISVIRSRAEQRTPQRDTTPWVRFEPPPAGTDPLVVSLFNEDIDRAAKHAVETLQPRLFERQPVALDFRNVSVCTQSFLHALLFEAIRVSWALQTPIYIENADPAVAEGIKLVDNYARGG